MRAALVLSLLALAACFDAPAPEWQLDHDRVIAVRASPPGIAAGGVATLDALVAHAGAPVAVEQPVEAAAIAPAAGLAGAVALAEGAWQVTAPGDAQLASARAALGYAEGAPVPLDVLVEVPGGSGAPLAARKTVWLGEPRANPPEVGVVTVAGAPPGAELVIPRGVDVPLAVDPGDPGATVMWLTSCGTMHDDQERAAFVHIGPGDSRDGQLVLVVRDGQGGVAWQVWPMHAE